MDCDARVCDLYLRGTKGRIACIELGGQNNLQFTEVTLSVRTQRQGQSLHIDTHTHKPQSSTHANTSVCLQADTLMCARVIATRPKALPSYTAWVCVYTKATNQMGMSVSIIVSTARYIR